MKSLELVTLRNDFYRDNFRRMVTICLLSLIANAILAASLVFSIKHHQKPIYFASSTQGQLVNMKPLNQPILSDTAVKSWISRSLPSVFDMDFVNYQRNMNNSRKFFTDYGWENFLTAFNPVLEKIKTDQLVTSATVTDVPYIVSKGIKDGIYTWEVQVPLIISYQKAGKETISHQVWLVMVQRNNNQNTDTPQLLGISQVVKTLDKNQ